MKSFFMMDNSKDHGKEAMLGYQISWLMRLATRKDVENRKLHEISRFTLLQLLDMKDCRDVDIVENALFAEALAYILYLDYVFAVFHYFLLLNRAFAAFVRLSFQVRPMFR